MRASHPLPSRSFEDDAHFAISGPIFQQPNFEEDALWAVLRKVPGLLLWAGILSCFLLPLSYPTALAWLTFLSMAQNLTTLLFTLLYTYRGFTRMAKSMSNPVRIPPLEKVQPRPEGAQLQGNASGTPPLEEVVQPAQVLHIIAITRCTEPIEVLEETIDNLAIHSNRGAYIILLCLEAKDRHAATVGETLVRKYAGVFYRVMYAIHPSGVEWEVPGKSANVNWGVRAAYASLEADMGVRSLDRMVVTVADCDAKVSEHYFNELSVRFAAAARDKREVFWAPPMLFDEEGAEASAEYAASLAGGGDVPPAKPGALEYVFGRNVIAAVRAFTGGVIPAPVKIADQMWAIFVLQNLTSANWVHLPCSTYSVGIKLIASVGFWDTGVESVPEDYHTALKLYWATAGRCRCEVIYHPVVYQHIDAGGWFATVYQRFQQGIRHMWGATDCAYILWLTIRVPTLPWSTRIRMVLTVFDVHVHASITTMYTTIAYVLMSLLRPGWLGVGGEGRPFMAFQEITVPLAFVVSFSIGLVYEWYGTEMLAACKRVVEVPEAMASIGSPAGASAPSQLTDGALASGAGAPSPSSGASEASVPGNLALLLQDAAGSAAPVADFVTLDASGMSSRPALSDAPPALPRGQIAVKDRSLFTGLTTCTSASAWDYFLCMAPWLWSPFACAVYLLGTAANAQTKLIWANRMRPHVSPKSMPTPSSTPRNQLQSHTPGTATPPSSMAPLSGRLSAMSAAESSAVWDAARSGSQTPVAGPGGRSSIRLQLPNAAGGGAAAAAPRFGATAQQISSSSSSTTDGSSSPNSRWA
jgi:hypothetical protein